MSGRKTAQNSRLNGEHRREDPNAAVFCGLRRLPRFCFVILRARKQKKRPLRIAQLVDFPKKNWSGRRDLNLDPNPRLCLHPELHARSDVCGPLEPVLGAGEARG